jgi:hypothetical protein
MAPCSLVDIHGFSEVPAASIIEAIALHGATSQKTAIFILAAVKT